MVNIPKDDVNKCVHVSWAKKGCRFYLQKIVDNIAYLVVQSSGKVLKASINDLQYLRKHEPKIYGDI